MLARKTSGDTAGSALATGITMVMPGPMVTENLRDVSSSSDPPFDLLAASLPDGTEVMVVATALDAARVASGRAGAAAGEARASPVVFGGMGGWPAAAPGEILGLEATFERDLSLGYCSSAQGEQSRAR